MQKIIKRSENFSEWYTSLIKAAKLAIYSSIKGEIIIQPNGWKIWTLIQSELNQRFAKLSIENLALPTFIKYSEFTKEMKHMDGFAPEAFIVTKKGNETLTDPYIIRPTSEVLFCEYFKQITNSYNDLPIKVNQWCNVFRAEKNTRPFLRTSEFFWHEFHSIHSTKTEAKNMALTMFNLYADFFKEFLLIPGIKGEKTIGERFAGADNTYTIEALMQDNQALQSCTSHYLAQNFSKIYGITFQNNNNQKEYVYQTSAGLSTRIIGGLIMTHSDDHGLVLPFNLAPTQIAILPIMMEKNKNILPCCKKIFTKLNKKYRVKLDDSNNGLGYKISEQEVLGTPFSIIIGNNDLNNNQFTLFRRDLNTKAVYKISECEKIIDQLISIYQNELYSRAKKHLDSNIIEVNSLSEFEKSIKKYGFILAPWGGDALDEAKLKQKYNITPRCIESEIVNNHNINCFFTNKKAKYWVYFARAY